MSEYLVQDVSLKRALDALGLRGYIQHFYESTVVPTVSVGNLGQGQVWTVGSTSTVFTGTATIHGPVPAGETWRLKKLSGIVAQSGGTVAMIIAFRTIHASGGSPHIIYYPTMVEGVSNYNIRVAPALNASVKVLCEFMPDTLMYEGQVLQVEVVTAGDGTRSAAMTLIYERLGENIVTSQIF